MPPQYPLRFRIPCLLAALLFVSSCGRGGGQAPAGELAFLTQPVDVTSGEVLTTVEVALQTADGDTLTGTSTLVTLKLLAGGPGGTLAGTIEVAALDGVAVFSDLSVDVAGSHVLKTTASGFAAAESNPFEVFAGSAAYSTFSGEPSSVVGGQPIAPAVEVTLIDAQGNVATSATTPVTIAFAGDPGLATLTGTLSVTPVEGVATLSDLVVHGPASGYSLSASTGTLDPATSGAFQVLAVTLPAASDNLAAFFRDELIASIPWVSGSGAGADPSDQNNQYILPTAAQLATWRIVIRKMIGGDYGGAHTLVKTVSETYNVIEYFDTAGGAYQYVLMEGVPGAIPAPISQMVAVSITDPADPTRRGWGTYVFNPLPAALLSVSSPHPKDDLETGDEGIEAYLETGACSFLLAGTDRDQNADLASCDQSARPYLQADAAHNVESVFQIAFEEIFLSDNGLYHVQLHGNATCAEDVFLSNGFDAPPAVFTTLAINIDATSQAWAGGGPTLSIDVYDDAGDCTLRATKNIQLRFAAGFPHAEVCDAVTPSTSSRFIHVESLRIARRAFDDPQATPGRNRAVVIEGLRLTF